jgi:ribosomal protein L30/L7E/ribosomal protein S21
LAGEADQEKASHTVLRLDDVVRILRKAVEKAGSQAEFARQESIRPSNLNSTITARRPPTKDVLRAMNLRKAFACESLTKGRYARILELDRVIRILRKEVEKAGGQTGFARKNGVNRPNLNSALLRKRPPTSDVLKALRLKKTFGYEPAPRTKPR